jgi:hypothetical protein
MRRACFAIASTTEGAPSAAKNGHKRNTESTPSRAASRVSGMDRSPPDGFHASRQGKRFCDADCRQKWNYYNRTKPQTPWRNSFGLTPTPTPTRAILVGTRRTKG